jgi:aldose sugar dehydrogenase
MRYSIYLFCLLASLACNTSKTETTKAISPIPLQPKQEVAFRVDTVATGLKFVFGMDWLPDGRALIMERGRATDYLSVMDVETGSRVAVCNLPKAHKKGQGGALDVLVHPDYAQNGWIYFSYAAPRGTDQNTMVVERAKLKDQCLVDRQPIFEVRPWHDESFHYGNRLVIRDGYLYFTMGERFFARDSAQVLTNHFGKTFRLHDDGRIPEDNPFNAQLGGLSPIYTYGHRNPQGLAFRPGTDQLWESEHGPQGGDEVNLLRPGANYGWPVITFGENYGGGKIGDGITDKIGMEQPVHYYVPSIAPGGMTWYDGNAFPAWRGNLFIGALAKAHLNRLVFEGDKVVKEERLLDGVGHQIRLVKQGPDGLIYFSTNDGLLLRLQPK